MKKEDVIKGNEILKRIKGIEEKICVINDNIKREDTIIRIGTIDCPLISLTNRPELVKKIMNIVLDEEKGKLKKLEMELGELGNTKCSSDWVTNSTTLGGWKC